MSGRVRWIALVVALVGMAQSVGLLYTGLFVMHIIGAVSYQLSEGKVLYKMGIGAPPMETQA